VVNVQTFYILIYYKSYMDVENSFLFSQSRQSPRELFLMKWIPRSSLIMAVTSFLFQVTVLYPWHLELSKEFEALSLLVRNVTKN
jgi:hypothetical protein